MPALIKRISDLRLEGPTIEVAIFPPEQIVNQKTENNEYVQHKLCTGLIDTGASNSCIDVRIAKELNLISRDYIPILTPSGISNHFTYDIGLMMPQQLGYKLYFIEVMGAELEMQPYHVLIGRDILQHLTLIFNGWDNSFQIHI